MKDAFRSAAVGLVLLATLALVLLAIHSVTEAREPEEVLRALAYSGMAGVFLLVGSIAYRRAWMVPSGPAFAIHADSPGASVPRVRAR